MYRNNIIRLGILFLILFIAQSVKAQIITSSEIDSLVEKALLTFNVPGIAVAVIKDGNPVHSKGYGVRSLSTMEPVTETTLFGIASNSKAFTTATLGILVDEGKISWDDRVIDYIPEFRLYSPYVTEDFRIRDLLTHRSGLGLGAGDLMFFPDSTNFTLDDLIYNLRFLKQTSPFRSKFDYDNLLYMVAGEVVARVSGMSWEEFVEKRIMEPLGMKYSAASYERLKDKSNVIDAHAEVNGKVKTISRHHSMKGENPAGGIYSNIVDLSKWIIIRLNEGKYGDNSDHRLFSSEVHKEMWTPQTVLPVGKDTIYNTHFRAYGLGWFLSDVAGHLEVTHTGGLEGMVTQITLLPELNLGIIVLTNQQTGEAFRSITNTIKDSYLGLKKRDWIQIYKERLMAKREKAEKIVAPIWAKINEKISSPSMNIDPDNYAGRYKDKWFGEIEIVKKDNRLFFRALRSPKLNGEMFHYNANTFVVKWKDRSFDADAFVMFNLNPEGKAIIITMKAISPLTDFSYDFHDLEFHRIK